jgi:hypothetical protein
MAKRKQQVQVKSYRRKDGTIVRSSNRAVLTVGKDVRKEKRQNKLGNYLKTGAKIGGALGGALGGLSGAAAGGMVLGPAGALAGAGLYGASGALGGGISGAGYGAATYATRKKFAKNKSKKNFDYSRINTNTGDNNQIMFIGQIEQEGSSYNFARKRGSKDKKKRQRRSMLGTAAKLAGGAAAIGATGLALKNAPKAIKTGMRAAKSARGSLAGQNSTNKLFGAGAGLKTAGASLRRNMGKDIRGARAATMRAGYGAADRVGGVVNRVKKGVKNARNSAELRLKGSRQLSLFD